MKPEITMVGRLTRDVTSIFQNEDGSSKRAIFTVACNSSYKKEGGEKVQDTAFVPCIAWGPMADLLEEWGLKGRLVAIRGNLESYQAPPNDNGEYPPTKIQVRVRELEFLGFEEKVREKFESRNKEEAANKAPEAEDLARALLGLLNKNSSEKKEEKTTTLAEALKGLI